MGYYIQWHEDIWSAHGFARIFRGIAERTLPGTAPYWYLYGYIAFLLMLPILQRAIKNISRTEYLVLFYLHAFFWTVLPLIDCVGQFTITSYKPISFYDAFEVPLANEKAFFFAITGYYIDKKIDMSRLTRKKMMVLILSGIAGVILMAYLTRLQGTHFGYTTDYVQTFDYIASIVLFLAVKKCCVSLSNKTITIIARLTFGIYLLDPVWHMLFDASVNKFFDGQSPMVKSLTWCLLSFSLGALLTAIWLFIKKSYRNHRNRKLPA